MARRPHHHRRRRSYGPRGHEHRERSRDWDLLEDAAAQEAAEHEADREAADAIPIAYTMVTHEDWVLTDREPRP